jgi:hypothetical protein
MHCRLDRIRELTLALMAGMEVGLSITALKPIHQDTADAACLLVFSFLGLWLDGWV